MTTLCTVSHGLLGFRVLLDNVYSHKEKACLGTSSPTMRKSKLPCQSFSLPVHFATPFLVPNSLIFLPVFSIAINPFFERSEHTISSKICPRLEIVGEIGPNSDVGCIIPRTKIRPHIFAPVLADPISKERCCGCFEDDFCHGFM